MNNKMTIKEILHCVEYCGGAEQCTSEHYGCCYGDEGLIDCVDRLQEDYSKIVDLVMSIENLDRLQEICNAERDGRLVALPCKSDDAVWICDGTEVMETTVWFVSIGYNNSTTIICKYDFTEHEIGKTVFLTKSAAEQALLKANKQDCDIEKYAEDCKDCEYFHIKNPVGYSKAFCTNWKNSVGEIKTVIRKCKYYKKEEIKEWRFYNMTKKITLNFKGCDGWDCWGNEV